METDDFWQLVERARQDAGDGGVSGDALAAALLPGLKASTLDRVLGFDRCFRRAHDRAFQWNLWAAAELMWGFCSDDSFSGFRAGLIGLGREAFEQVVADPDSLADHVLVQRIASGEVEALVLYMEPLEHVASLAYASLTGDGEAFYDAVRQIESQETDYGHSRGVKFDFGDAAEMRRRLPKMSALFLGESRAVR